MKTMILDNNLDNIKIYDDAGVSRIFIDLEIIGKVARQWDMDTVISDHTISDIINARGIIKNAELLVRVNPIHDSSEAEINAVINAGADIVMLPMFKTKQEVEKFITFVDKRAKTNLLLETSQAFARIDDILSVPGIDEVHIGLNDLHLAFGLTFMFELMSGSLCEYITNKFKEYNVPFGIGGVSTIGTGILKSEVILREHVRLGSEAVILSRSFKKECTSLTNFKHEINKLNDTIIQAKQMSSNELKNNKTILKESIAQIIEAR